MDDRSSSGRGIAASLGLDRRCSDAWRAGDVDGLHVRDSTGVTFVDDDPRLRDEPPGVRVARSDHA
jgi:hypothetical protein